MSQRDYYDITTLNPSTKHHSVGLHYRGFSVCLDVQCGDEDEALVKRLVRYLKSTLKAEGKKSLDQLDKYHSEED